MSVLILSRTENVHADVVEENLKNREIKTIRINIDDINSVPPLVSINQNNLNIQGEKLQLDEIQSVFVHHPRIEVSEKIGIDRIDRKIIGASWSAFIIGLENVLNKSRWVNSLSASSHSTNIFGQLGLAKEIGFRIPKTCFSNDINIVQNFTENFDKTILKPGPLVGVHLKGKRILTRIVDPKLITAVDLIHSPCFFQEYIDKAFELRIHVIGDKVLTCKIESQKSELAKTDWRRYDIANTPHYPYELGEKEEKQCIEITRKLRLEMGVIDMIVTPKGEHIFLECNSNGYWIWIEELTGLPITQTVCDLLATPK